MSKNGLFASASFRRVRGYVKTCKLQDNSNLDSLLHDSTYIAFKRLQIFAEQKFHFKGCLLLPSFYSTVTENTRLRFPCYNRESREKRFAVSISAGEKIKFILIHARIIYNKANSRNTPLIRNRQFSLVEILRTVILIDCPIFLYILLAPHQLLPSFFFFLPHSLL